MLVQAAVDQIVAEVLVVGLEEEVDGTEVEPIRWFEAVAFAAFGVEVA